MSKTVNVRWQKKTPYKRSFEKSGKKPFYNNALTRVKITVRAFALFAIGCNSWMLFESLWKPKFFNKIIE